MTAPRLHHTLFAAVALALAAPAGQAEVDVKKLPPSAGSFDFARDIQPLLESACVKCHGAEKQKGDFRIDTRAGLLKGGKEEKAIVEGDSARSPLIHYVARLVEDLEMPPKGKGDALTPAQIGVLRAWIDAGAKWPDGLVLKTPAAGPSAAKLAQLPPAATRTVDFVRDIQPIFSESCYSCHGPKKQEANFRLDHKPTVLVKGGELGPALVAGKSAESLLIHLVAGLRDEVMPQKGARLTAEQIGLLRAWIDQGAAWPDAASVVLVDRRDHWAFKPPVKAPLPAVKNAAWVRSPIDAFILARLEKDGLQPAPEADQLTLLRRLSLDLIGLPPSIAEVDGFLADADADALTKQSDRLLSSPHYGEKWGRHWLDAARYADTDGYEKDKARYIWFYRDWVIDAFNRDLPYNQFLVEQLAGDQLPNATQGQIVATGFLRNSMVNEEGGADPEQFRMEAMFDRMDAFGKAVLGLTIQCAQCHNHKYDPISQEEYYRLFAFLNNDNEAQPTVYTSDEQTHRADVLRKVAEAEEKLRASTPDWRERMARWEDALPALPEWKVITGEFEANSLDGSKYLPQKGGGWLAQSYAPTRHDALLYWKVPEPGITALRLELLNDPNLPAGGPGRSYKGTCALTEFALSTPTGQDGKMEKVKFANASADFGQTPETPVEAMFQDKKPVRRVVGPVSYAIDDKRDTAWGIDAGQGRRNVPRNAVFNLPQPLNVAAGAQAEIVLDQRHGGWNSDDLMTNNLGRFRLSYTTATAAAADPVPPRVREIFRTPRAQRTPAQLAEIFGHWRTTVTEWKDENARIETLWQQHPEGTTTFALAPREGGRETHVLKRGDWLKPARAVRPGVPAILNPLPADAPPTRLTLARWITDPRAPTTARAFVNRVWLAYFGTGLVETAEDLGTQASPPSHPELLDWLACDFMEHGWSVKHLQRLITGSATYRQSSVVTPSLLERDPFNRLLARGPRFRVDGELVRDIQLATSGLLNPKIGGKPTMPPAPAFLFQPPASYAPFPWIDETGPERYRRAVYTWRRRTTPYPLLQAFDTPEGQTTCIRRTRANTPLQALITLNETLGIEAAQALARRIIERGGVTDDSRLTFAFRQCLSRPPADAERRETLALLTKQRARFAGGGLDPWTVATGKAEPSALSAGTTPQELATYTVLARVLLNLDETITKE
ncbi:MAG: PSD1 and planctomycete cytochrome C domain-containing protein [Chthoniobacter sp.]|nr:PSD1 and planctomycete cytochrome C domain-containing protein [Chthoniobacter sp.]